MLSNLWNSASDGLQFPTISERRKLARAVYQSRIIEDPMDDDSAGIEYGMLRIGTGIQKLRRLQSNLSRSIQRSISGHFEKAHVA